MSDNNYIEDDYMEGWSTSHWSGSYTVNGRRIDSIDKLLTEQALLRNWLTDHGVEYPTFLTLEELRDRVIREKVRQTTEGWDLDGQG